MTTMLTSPLQLRSSEPQTLHLVLRPTGPDPLPVHSSTPFIPPQRVTTPISPQMRPQSTPAHPIHGMHAQQALIGFQHLHQHHTAHQAEHWQNGISQRLQALQRETVRLQQEMGNIEQRSRALVSAHPGFFNAGPPPPQLPQIPQALQHLLQQGQNERASADGRHGVPSSGNETSAGSVHRQTGSGRASPNIHRPDHTTTYNREGIGPNGERWQVTVNESSSTFQIPQHPPFRQHDHPQVPGTNPALDTLQALARTTDRLFANQRTQPSQNVQHGSGGGASNPVPSLATAGQASQAQFPRVQPANSSNGAPAAVDSSLPPQIFNPVFNPYSVVRNSAPLLSLANDTRGFINDPPRSSEPMVYILSSPQGPQALLLHNSETYYSLPQVPTHHTSSSSLPPFPRRRRYESPAPDPAGYAQIEDRDPAVAPEFQDVAAHPLGHNDNGNQQDNQPLEPVGAPHGNPGAGALGARIGPMIWLILRLAGFVWFFTAGNSSWPRFVMITALAIIVFIINTGIFNGIAEAMWGPVRRHVEALIPLAGPEAALVPAVNAAAIPQQLQQVPVREGRAADGPGPRRRRGELDEVEVAARLIRQQREARGDWWLTQVRRIEHAALLFLASLVPGVGERHIAAREAAANAAEAERQREIEAAEAAAVTENFQGDNPEAQSEQPEEESRDSPENSRPPDEGEGHAAAQPVVAEG
jgi:hypothetical protein